MTTSESNRPHLLLYVPNIIGYIRFLALIGSVYFALEKSISPFLWLYFICHVLDHFDGYAARSLDQCSQYGACLDLLVDRTVTVTMCFLLTPYYPSYGPIFAFLTFLDFGSSFMYTCAFLGSKHAIETTGDHHKEDKTNWLVHIYYNTPHLLDSMLFCHDHIFAFLYAMKVGDNSIQYTFLGYSLSFYEWAVIFCTPLTIFWYIMRFFKFQAALQIFNTYHINVERGQLENKKK